MKNTLYIATTYYQILITILKLMHSGENADLLIYSFAGKFVFSDIGQGFIDKLNDLGVFGHIYQQTSRGFETWSFPKKAFFLCFKRKYLAELFKPEVENIDNYSDIYIYGDVSSRSHYFLLTHTDYHLIEAQLNALDRNRVQFSDFIVETKDGVLSKLGYLIKKYLFRDFLSLGQARCCMSIEVNDKSNLAIPFEKVVELPREQLFSFPSAEQKRQICEVFLDPGIFDNNSNNSKNTLLLLDAILAAATFDGDESLAIDTYRKIIEHEQQNGFAVVVKPHPGDKSDYLNIFPGIVLIDANIPIEILNLCDDIHFERAITVYSSAINGIKFADEKIVLGHEYVEKIR